MENSSGEGGGGDLEDVVACDFVTGSRDRFMRMSAGHSKESGGIAGKDGSVGAYRT